MLRLAADENLNRDIVRGLLRQKSELDIVRIQDVGLSGANDPTVLAWAAGEGRVLLTHDVTTLTHHAYDRVRAGQPMPGVFEVSRHLPVGQAIEDLLLLAECSREGEWEGQSVASLTIRTRVSALRGRGPDHSDGFLQDGCHRRLPFSKPF